MYDNSFWMFLCISSKTIVYDESVKKQIAIYK